MGRPGYSFGGAWPPLPPSPMVTPLHECHRSPLSHCVYPSALCCRADPRGPFVSISKFVTLKFPESILEHRKTIRFWESTKAAKPRGPHICICPGAPTLLLEQSNQGPPHLYMPRAPTLLLEQPNQGAPTFVYTQGPPHSY